MRKVIFTFPDRHSMADFIKKEKMKDAEVDSSNKTLVTTMNDEQIKIAETVYKAFLRAMIPQD